MVSINTSGLCPECKQGKKINCTGEYYDVDDALTTCRTQYFLKEDYRDPTPLVKKGHWG